jgi:hypothetical protein
LAGAGSAIRGIHGLGWRPIVAALLAPIHRAGPGDLAAAGRLGDTAIHRQVLQLQAVQAVIGGQRQAVPLVGHTQGDPLIPAAAQGRGRAGVVGDPAVATAKTRIWMSLSKMTRSGTRRRWQPRVMDLAGGQQRDEPVPPGFLDAGWQGRHETSR